MAFVSNSSIVSGLSDIGSNSRPNIFFFSGELYMIDGATMGAFKYNTGTLQWESNTLFSTFAVAPGTNRFPCVFTLGGNLYMILGLSSTWNGYIWNGTQWVADSGIKTGLPTIAFGSATVFSIGIDTYLISGKDTGLFSGFKWSGTQWNSDSSIITGLTDVGDYSRPTAFYNNTDLYLISGKDGGFSGFKWNGSQWLSDSISSGLTGNGFTHPSTFSYGSNIYTISGNSDGTFSGFALAPLAKLSSVVPGCDNNYSPQLVITLSQAATLSETIKGYFSNTLLGLDDPESEVTLSTSDNITYRGYITINEGDIFYFRAKQLWSSTTIATINNNGTFFMLPQVNVSTINITDANNYKIFSSPQHSYNHGMIFYQDYIYGSSRGQPTLGDTSIFKISSTDYSIVTTNTIYLNKNSSTGRLFSFDQIIQCSGFLWVSISEYLVRINISDLDYMIFDSVPESNYSQPLCTDGEFIYICSDLAVYKIDPSYLIGAFIDYGYNGNAPVNIPVSAIGDSCNIIQYHPTEMAYVHSSGVDANYIYLSVTTCDATFYNGYDSGLDLYFLHFQKIDKQTMITVGDVITPKCSDDMVQTGEYVFLNTEIIPGYESSMGTLGITWQLLAINKQTLEIKYLKALHSDYFGSSVALRDGFGVFYFSDKLFVLHANAKTLIVLDTTNINQWGNQFPVGGATNAVYKFQLNGVDFSYPCNELVLDNFGNVHLNTWQASTMIFKLGVSQLTDATKTPTIQTILINSNCNSATIGGYIIDEGESPITLGGFLYSTDPENLNIDIPVDPFTYNFYTVINDLSPGVYYIKAYGTNLEGTWYGNTILFSTYNVLKLFNDTETVEYDCINVLNGCSLRCVQDAPFSEDGETGTATDVDGNIYNTIVINKKRWFVESLRTTKYNNGIAIPNITDNIDWGLQEDGAFCVYNNNLGIIDCSTTTTTTTIAP